MLNIKNQWPWPFFDENIKCINNPTFVLVYWHCVTFPYEDGGRIAGQNWAKAKTYNQLSLPRFHGLDELSISELQCEHKKG